MNDISFRAKPIATTKNIYKKVATKIDIYELTPRDKQYLEDLRKNTDYKKLAPDLCEYAQKRWQKVFNYAIDEAQSKYNKSYIAIHEGKPCGIMAVGDDISGLKLECICDIPSKDGKRVNYTGSTLFCQLFKLADELKSKCINLSAVPDGPFNVVKKYQEKGFKTIDQSSDYVEMRCNKYNIKEQLNELLSKITYKPLKGDKEIDLSDLA